MKILISAPSGYNSREILLPLQQIIESDKDITTAYVLSPAAPFRQKLFPSFSNKFDFHPNPDSQTDHNHLLGRLKPNIVITPTIGLDPKDTPLLRAAKNNGIPTLTFVASWDNVFKIERLKTRGHSGHTKQFAGDFELPDYFAVWNAVNKAHLEKIFPEFPPSKIIITGPPRFDYFSHNDKIPSKQALFKYLNINSPPDDTFLIHCATTELYPFEYIIKDTIASMTDKGQDDRFHVHASVHPGGDIKKHLQYKKYNATVAYSFGRRSNAPHPDFKYLPTLEEIYYLVALFKHASLLINQSSTVAIESMRCDVPVINVQYGQPRDWLRWRRSMVYRDFQQHYRYITDGNATSLVKNPRQLRREINAYLSRPEIKSQARTDTTSHLITYTDGRCGQRLLSFAKSICANK